MALVPLIVFRMVIISVTLYGFVDTAKRVWALKKRFYDPLPKRLKQQLINLFKGTPESRARARRWLINGSRYVLKKHGLELLPNLLLLSLLLTINVLSFTLLHVVP